MPGVLIVSANPHFRKCLARALQGVSHRISSAADLDTGRQRVLTGRPHITVVDCPVMVESTWLLLAAARNGESGTDVIVCTGAYTAENAVLCLKGGAREFLGIPVDFTVLADKIQELLDRREPSPHYLARRLDRYIRRNLSDCNLTLTSVCQRFGISTSYASKLFSRQVGVTFRRRLKQHRLMEARKLLQGTNEPIYSIADSCGFRNQGRLSEAFCRTEGVPPRRYRELARGGPEL